MREITVGIHAERVIDNVAAFIDSQNLPDSSDKWINEILDFIRKHASLQMMYAPCKNEKLAKRKLSCIVFKKKWVIAFPYTDRTFTVHQIIYGSKLK